jgi:hypothetical protein
MNDQDQQDWDAAATEAGYLPTSDYVEKWKLARAAAYEALQTAQEFNRQAMIALEEATISYFDAVDKFLKGEGK